MKIRFSLWDKPKYLFKGLSCFRHQRELGLELSGGMASEFAHRTGPMKFNGPHSDFKAFSNLPVGESRDGKKRRLALSV